MEILLNIAGIITVISMLFLLTYLIAKKKFLMIATAIGIVIIAFVIIILANSNTNQDPGEKSSYISSGAFTVPMGKGPWESKVYVKKSELFWVASSSPTKIVDCRNGRTALITSKGWIPQQPARKPGFLTFMKTNKKIRIDFKIIN